MTYHINVNQDNNNEFLQIILSLRKLGVIESVESTTNLVIEGKPIQENTLLNILKHSKEEMKEGKSFTIDEVKKQIESWKKK